MQFSSAAQSCPTLWPHEPQHTRPPCPSPTPRVHPNPCPLSQWCHPTISSSVVPFSSCPQSFPASGSFPMSQFFASGGQSIVVSASATILPMNIQDWFPLYILQYHNYNFYWVLKLGILSPSVFFLLLLLLLLSPLQHYVVYAVFCLSM